jgi:cellulose synthase operon protein YhjU
MGLWNLYFLAKIYLFHTGQMQPIWLLNLVFALLLVIPLESRILRVLRQIAIGAGAALAWRESTLPPFARCSQVSNITFTPDTWWSYSSASCRWRWWWPWCWWSWSLLINRWIRTTTFVLLALIAMPIWYGTGITLPAGEGSASQRNPTDRRADINATNNYDAILAAFRQRKPAPPSPFTATPDAQFDIIVLHICSLSWDDLDAAKPQSPLLSRFDLFKNFSSPPATAARPPSACCARHAASSRTRTCTTPRPPTTCSPIWPRPASRRILMNHDGRFDNFRNYVETEIGIQGVKMESTDGVPVAMRAFDDSPILDDFNTFDHWYKQHLAQDKAPWRSTTTRSRCTTAIACPTSA